MGLAFTSGNDTLMYMGLGVGAIFLVLMGGAHHIIVAIVAVGAVYLGYQMAESTGNQEYMLYALLGAGLLFMIFVLHGKEESEQGGMDMMGGMGIPMGY